MHKRDKVSERLHRKCLSGDFAGVVECISLGADVNYRSADGRNSLHYGVMNGSELIIRTLFEAGASDLHAKDAEGLTPIDIIDNSDVSKIVSLYAREYGVALLTP